MTETIKAITNAGGKTSEMEIHREDFERAIFELLTDPGSELYRYSVQTDGGAYTHLRFRKKDEKFFEFKITRER